MGPSTLPTTGVPPPRWGWAVAAPAVGVWGGRARKGAAGADWLPLNKGLAGAVGKAVPGRAVAALGVVECRVGEDHFDTRRPLEKAEPPRALRAVA